MRCQKGLHVIAPMPHDTVDVQPNCVAAERVSHVAQGGEKALVVPVGMAQHATTAQQRGDPPKDIQAFPMGTARGHPEALAAFRPAAPHARVEREARFVFEDNGLARGQCGESFFRLSWNCRASSARAWT